MYSESSYAAASLSELIIWIMQITVAGRRKVQRKSQPEMALHSLFECIYCPRHQFQHNILWLRQTVRDRC